MFNTLGSFSVVYFALAAVLFVLILFEKHFIQLEEKISAKKVKTKKNARYTGNKNSVHKTRKIAVKTNSSTTYRKVPNNAA